MSSPALETFLARLYTDARLRQRFLERPRDEARGAGLDEDEVAALCAIDRAGLQMAAASYAHKRLRRGRVTLRRRLARWWRLLVD